MENKCRNGILLTISPMFIIFASYWNGSNIIPKKNCQIFLQKL